MGCAPSELKACRGNCSTGCRCGHGFPRKHEATGAEDEPVLVDSEPVVPLARCVSPGGGQGEIAGSQDRACASDKSPSKGHSTSDKYVSNSSMLWSFLSNMGVAPAALPESNQQVEAENLDARELTELVPEAVAEESDPSKEPEREPTPPMPEEPEPASPTSFMRKLQRKQSFSLQVGIENFRSITDCYDFRGEVGKGSFGSVRKAVVKVTHAVRAVKMISKEKVKRNARYMEHEVDIMKTVDHPNIVKLYELFEDLEFMYLVMELCTGGSLLTRLKHVGKFPEAEAAELFRQIVRAVSYLHNNNIVHRDMKTENCLLTQERENNLRLTDFGLSRTFKRGQPMISRVGTPHYMSPQVYSKCYDHSCDMWACGVLLYVLLCGYLPFWDACEEKLQASITQGRYKFEAADWVDASASTMELVSRLLVVDQTKRLTAEQALNHEWIRSFGSYATAEPIDKTLIENLLGFRSLNKFKRVALCVIASLLGEDQIGRSRQHFIALDERGAGKVSLHDLFERIPVGSRPTDMFVRQTSLDRCETFTYTEFLAATFDRSFCCKKDVCWVAFNMFDRNQDGSIAPWELEQDEIMGKLTPEEMDRVIADLDQNGDGGIDFQEFMEMMRDGEGYSPLLPSSPKSKQRFRMPKAFSRVTSR